MSGYRLALVAEPVLDRLLEAEAEADGAVYRIEWGEPRTEVVTYYEPRVVSVPKAPLIETRGGD